MKDYLCIGNGKDFRFIHKLGMPVARLQAPFYKGWVMGSKLLLFSSNEQLLFLDLGEAIN